jgi:flagella basal body P-ring formation protein FlgA
MATMIRIATMAALLALTAPAAAQVTGSLAPPVPALKRAVTVSADIVRIGDLFDNAGPLADAPIFRSPDIGTTGSVSVKQVLDAIRPHHLYLVDTRDLTEVEVTRAGRMIGAQDLQTRIVRALAGRYGLADPKNLVVTMDREVSPITFEGATMPDLQVLRSHFDPRTGRFDVAVSFDAPGAPARRVWRYSGTLVEMIETAVLARGLTRGDIVKASDIVIERRPKAEVGNEPFGAGEPAVGLAARQALRAGQVLHRADLMKPEIVRRDDNVTLVYQVPGILLTTRGKALESGSDGDLINVLNLQSKRTVQGTISGPGRVVMSSTTRAQADAPQTFASRFPE